jgi:hypothetical protein
MTLRLKLRLYCHKPYGTSSIAEVVNSNCSNRSTIQPQQQGVIGRTVFVCVSLIVITESSSFPENLPADRMIFPPIALGPYFDKLVIAGYPSSLPHQHFECTRRRKERTVWAPVQDDGIRKLAPLLA